ncbi:unnamed protein product [Symbiodinium sp. CCMP2592]|nr:unnamed protein product [Symbiodinium sp. CCMP2592]
MGGVYGGLDSSTLLRVEDAAHEEVARAAFRAFRAFCREYDLKAKLISNKYTVTDLRAMDTQGQPTDFAVWVSQRSMNQWKKVTGESRETVPRHRLWRHFVREVQECRFGRAEPAENNDVPDGSDVEEVAAEGDTRMEIPADVREAVCTLHPKTNMLAGLLCDHGLMCRVRAACLVDRKDMEALLQASEEKDKFWSSEGLRQQLASVVAAVDVTGGGQSGEEAVRLVSLVHFFGRLDSDQGIRGLRLVEKKDIPHSGVEVRRGEGESDLIPVLRIRAKQDRDGHQGIGRIQQIIDLQLVCRTCAFTCTNPSCRQIVKLTEMYVYRLQQPLPAPRQKAANNARRRALRVAKRSVPVRRRVHLVSRRAHRLRDVPASSPRTGWVEPPPVPGPGERKREQVVDRLRLRLVSRRATQLIEALERRHGERWSEHVKAGGFHVDEAMRRICEAFQLRPELERQVLALARRRAQGWQAASECSASPSGSDGEQPAMPSRPGPLHKLVLVEHSFEDGPGSTRSTASTASFGSLSSPSEDEATLKDPSDLPWQEIDWLMDSTQRHCLDGGPKLGRAPWLQRALRTLDLDPPGARCATPPAPAREAALVSHPVDSQGEEEDEELSRKLVTAIINAERHAELSETLQEVLGDEGGVDDDDDRGPRRQRSIDFQDSDIRFFVIDPQGEAMGEEYCRALQTKAFDGPSGHKARKASCSDEGFDSSDDESDEEEEDWKDQCDEMADLMGQQRQMVLWSGSW